VYADKHRSKARDIDHRLYKGLRGFLRQIVPDATCDEPVLVFSGEFAAIGAAVRVWCPIGIAFKGDREHGDGQPLGQPLLQRVVA
jgi:hypothetical protein